MQRLGKAEHRLAKGDEAIDELLAIDSLGSGRCKFLQQGLGHTRPAQQGQASHPPLEKYALGETAPLQPLEAAQEFFAIAGDDLYPGRRQVLRRIGVDRGAGTIRARRRPSSDEILALAARRRIR